MAHSNSKPLIESPTSATDASRGGVPWLSWLARTALVVLALSITAAQAPEHVKLLGLFSVAVGGAMGAASAFLTQPHPNRVLWRWLLVMSLMAFAGLAGSTWLVFRADAALQAKSPQQQMAVTMMKQMERDSGGEIDSAPTASVVNEFRWHLILRVSKLGKWSSPWPELFWSLELLGGSVAAAWCFQLGATSSREAVRSRETSS